jgi:excinuclease ABC subunit C
MSIDLKNVPSTPGVYKFFNSEEIIYIGKAKDLKKRVSSYFGNSVKDRKASQIKLLTDKVETFTTKNEVEALLLEQMLIKENKPKFNILLRDDKTYPYIYFSLDHEFPGIYSKRTKQAIDKKFYGPFVSSEAVKKSIKEIQKIFKIRNCSDNTFANRTRPCIEFQMKRCSAPCVQKIKKADYYEDITSAKLFLSSSDKKTVKTLMDDIDMAVLKLDFEKAAKIRDRLKRLNQIKEEQSVITLANNIDIFSVSSEMNYLGVSIIVVRNGKIRGTKTHLIKQTHFSTLDDVYHSVVYNFYENQADIPKKILCAYALIDKKILENMFLTKHQTNVKIVHSASNSIRPIFNLCKLNAQQVIQNHISKEDKYTFAFNELGEYLAIKNINRIEAYDISHLSGEHAVASCVVFSKTGPIKKDFRLFNIPKDLSGNDIGSLKNVLERRIKYFDNDSIKPDLLLIDGGKSQLKFVNSVLNNSKHKNIKAISIVKGIKRVRATETIISVNGIVEVDKKSKAFLALQEIRNESHRFAIQALRRKKRKSITRSELDSIKGIGSVIKKRLLKKYKNLKNIKSSSLKDLMTVKGISEKIALEIKSKIE